MSRPLRFTVTGIDDLLADMRDLADDLADVPTMGDIARRTATLARSFAPKRTGNLASSIKPQVTKNRASVVATAEYAPVINFGWPKRNIRASEFMQRADQAARDDAVRDLTEAINAMISQRGLA